MLNIKLWNQTEKTIKKINQKINKTAKDLHYSADAKKHYINLEQSQLLNKMIAENPNDYFTIVRILKMQLNHELQDKSMHKRYKFSEQSLAMLEREEILKIISSSGFSTVFVESFEPIIKKHFKLVAPILESKLKQVIMNSLIKASLIAQYTTNQEIFIEYLKEIECIAAHTQIINSSKSSKLLDDLCCGNQNLIDELILELAPKYNYYNSGMFSYSNLSQNKLELILQNEVQLKKLIDYLNDKTTSKTEMKNFRDLSSKLIKLNENTQLKIIKEIKDRNELSKPTIEYIGCLINENLTKSIHKELSQIKYDILLDGLNIEDLEYARILPMYGVMMFLKNIESPIANVFIETYYINLKDLREISNGLDKTEFLKKVWKQYNEQQKELSIINFICALKNLNQPDTIRNHIIFGRNFTAPGYLYSPSQQEIEWVSTIFLKSPELQLTEKSYICEKYGIQLARNVENSIYLDESTLNNQTINNIFDVLIERGKSLNIPPPIIEEHIVDECYLVQH